MSTADRWNDPLVIEKLKEKEQAAIGRFIQDHQQNIFRVCLGFLHNKEDAEELTQDVFMQVFNNIHRFRGDCRLITWIYRICYTRAMNRLRENKWQKWLQSLDEVLFIKTAPLKNNDPADALEAKETETTIRRAIERLPATQKLAFVLHYYEALKYQEIAEVMKTSVAAVESRLFRARKNLQKQLQREIY